MTLNDILSSKGHHVFTIQPDATLDDVVQKLVSHNCGSLVVCNDNECQPILGIITERDILRAYASKQGTLEKIRVSDVMTVDLVTGMPHDSIEDTMGLMTNRRVRHLPIVEDGALRGMISIGDIVKAQHDHLSMENAYLKNYIHDGASAPGIADVAAHPR